MTFNRLRTTWGLLNRWKVILFKNITISIKWNMSFGTRSLSSSQLHTVSHIIIVPHSDYANLSSSTKNNIINFYEITLRIGYITWKFHLASITCSSMEIQFGQNSSSGSMSWLNGMTMMLDDYILQMMRRKSEVINCFWSSRW